MTTSFPTSIDSLTDPISTNPMTSPDHAGQHANANDAIVAIETAIGTTGTPVLAPLASPTFTGTVTVPDAVNPTDAAQLSDVTDLVVAPATTVTGPDSYGASAVVGTGTTYAPSDHDHGLPAAPT